MRKDGYRELFYAGKVLQRPLTGLATTTDKIKKNPRQVQRMMRAFLRTTRTLKSERNEFLGFAQKNFGFSKDAVEEAYKVMIDALSNDGIVENSVLQSAVDEAKAVANVAKPERHTDVVGLQFSPRRDGKMNCKNEFVTRPTGGEFGEGRGHRFATSWLP